MVLLLVFAVTLFVGVLLSSLAHRTILSTAVLFLVAGFVAGNGWLHVLRFQPTHPQITALVEVALFSVLYSDGADVNFKRLREHWSLPGRMLLVGMPVVMAATAVVARYVVRLSWIESLLVGAVLAPTDPVFASALIGREDVPLRLRKLLNVESGLNDGIAYPFVLLFLSLLGSPEPGFGALLWRVALGVGLGIAIPWVAIRLQRLPLVGAYGRFEVFNGLAIGLLVFALAEVTGANPFLAAFVAGITLANVAPEVAERFDDFGALLSELFKLLAILVLGALVSVATLRDAGWQGWVLAGAALALARPLAILLSLLGTPVSRGERLAAGWFGPRGFASVFFALLILQSQLASRAHLFNVVATVILASIVLHSSTDIVVARRFEQNAKNSRGSKRAA